MSFSKDEKKAHAFSTLEGTRLAYQATKLDIPEVLADTDVQRIKDFGIAFKEKAKKKVWDKIPFDS